MQQIQLTFEALSTIEDILNGNGQADGGIDPSDLHVNELSILLKARMPYLAAGTIQRYINEWKTYFVMSPETCTALTHVLLNLPASEKFDTTDRRALFEFMKRWFSGRVPVNREAAN